MIERLTGRNAVSASQLARGTGIRQQNLSRWLEEARTLPVVTAKKPSKPRSVDEKIKIRVETEELGFDFPNFELAWEVLAGVTTAQLPPERQREAREAVHDMMWPHGRGPRHFRNVTQFLVGRVAG